MIGIFIALLSGALMSIQGVWNTQVTRHTSVWVSVSWVQFSALFICLAAWLFFDRKSFVLLHQVEPRYMLLAGVLGAFITYTVVKSMALLGPAKAAMIIVTSQLVIAYLIELLGLFGVDKVSFEWKKCLGMGICIVGIILAK